MTSLGVFSTSDVITSDQNLHHLYSTSPGGKDLSNDAQIRMMGLMEPEICTKMLKKSSEKLRAKFPATTHGNSMVKIAHLNDAFFEVFNCKPSRRSITAVKRNRKEKKETFKGEKKITKIGKPLRRTRSLSCFLLKFWFLCIPEPQNRKMQLTLVKRKSSFHVANAFLARFRS